MVKTRLAAMCLLLAAGCSGESATADGVLIWARGSESTTLDPAEISNGEDAKIAQNVFEPLVTFKNHSVELEGRLAESWKMSDDGKTMTFELRKGVKFHDGTPFDAEAVVFSFGRLLDGSHPNKPKSVPYRANWSDIEKVEADGPHRVVITLKNPSTVILHNLTLFGACIVSPTAVRKHGDQIASNPVGTGPYRLARWERDVKIELKAFEGYWGPQPPIPRVIVVPVKSPQTAIEQLKKGEVHAVDHPTLADVASLQGNADTHVDIQTSMNVCHLGFNMKRFPYNDLNFRRAVSLALDLDNLNETVYFGQAEPARNVVPPAVWGDISTPPPHEYDPARARELLKKVKLESNDVELIHIANSRPYVPEPHRVAEWIGDQLRRIGLDVRLTPYLKSAMDVKVREDSHPMFLYGWNADIPHPDNFFYPLLHGASAPELNNSFWDDPEFNRAVEQAQRERDDGKRRALYVKAYDRHRGQVPTVALVHVKQITALRKGVEYRKHPIEFRFYTASLSE